MIKRTQPKPPAARAPISPLEVLGEAPEVCRLANGVALLRVTSYDGADAYHVQEITRQSRALAPDRIEYAYRTVQRLDLATRLQMVGDYEPLDLVDRVFLVGGKS